MTSNQARISLNSRPVAIDVGATGLFKRTLRGFEQDFTVLAFDPQAEGSRTYSGDNEVIFIDKALSSAPQLVTLHRCQALQVSSIYPPNTVYLNRFPRANRFTVLDRIEFEASTLDCEIEQLSGRIGLPRFMRLNVEGAELDVLKGCEKTLADMLFVLIEVSFCPLRIGQPLFPEVDQFMREKGFELYDLTRTNWREKFDEPSRKDVKGQLVFGNALYVIGTEILSERFQNTNSDGMLALLRDTLLLSKVFRNFGYFETVKQLALENSEFASSWASDVSSWKTYCKPSRSSRNSFVTRVLDKLRRPDTKRWYLSHD